MRSHRLIVTQKDETLRPYDCEVHQLHLLGAETKVAGDAVHVIQALEIGARRSEGEVVAEGVSGEDCVCICAVLQEADVGVDLVLVYLTGKRVDDKIGHLCKGMACGREGE